MNRARARVSGGGVDTGVRRGGRRGGSGGSGGQMHLQKRLGT